MLPQTLPEWSIDVVVALLTTGSFETEHFDFKKRLPYYKDEPSKTRLCKTCCAFANSNGGAIVFGIVDDKSKAPPERLVGMEANFDFPEHFGNYPRSCSPSVDWTFKNPPLLLDNGQVLHIVQIPKSWRAPHAVGDADGGWHFVKRTNKGNEGMSIEEIRLGFLGHYEKRLKLQLLRSELATLKENARTAYVVDEEQIEKSYSLITFDTRMIETIISDTYAITASDSELLQALAEIRQKTRVANNAINLFFSEVRLPLSNKKSSVRKHNESLQPICEQMMDLCDKATVRLDVILES